MSVEMKDSGIDWIGEIPKHWNIEKPKNMFSLRKTKGNTEAVLLAATQKYGMYPQHLLEGVVKVSTDTDMQSFKTVHKNDYVISLRSFQGGFEMSDYEGVCTPAYQVFYAKNLVNYRYYKFLFKTEDFISKLNSFTIGIREGKNIQYDDFARLTFLPVPSVEEQSLIANFLDKKCAEIDELIALQEQMIAQLTTYKQAVITETVTKGLDPNVKMKDSGVEWIGEIPENWDVVPLKYLGRTQNGISKGGDYFGEGYPFVNYGDIYKNYFIGSNDASGLAKSTIEDQKNYSVVKGDVFFTRTSETIEEIGFSCACIETIKNATFSGFLIRFRPYPEVLYPLFSGFYFRSTMHRQYFVKEMNIVTRTSLGQDLLKGLLVLLPPLSEQQSIANYLDQKCKEIDELISVKKDKIEKLKAYKKSVIYEYVTGKKQVI